MFNGFDEWLSLERKRKRHITIYPLPYSGFTGICSSEFAGAILKTLDARGSLCYKWCERVLFLSRLYTTKIQNFHERTQAGL